MRSGECIFHHNETCKYLDAKIRNPLCGTCRHSITFPAERAESRRGARLKKDPTAFLALILSSNYATGGHCGTLPPLSLYLWRQAMKASLFYRTAAVLLLLFAVAHTLGFRQSEPAWGVDTLLGSMR